MCSLPYNLGVGGAMRAGYRFALRHGYDVAVQIDADGQHDPRYVPQMVDRLAEADVVIGARFATANDPYKVRGPRRWAMVLLAGVLSRLAHTHLTDVTSGFRVSNRRAISLFARALSRRVPRRHGRVAGHRSPRGLRDPPGAGRRCGPGWPDAPPTPP